MNHERKKLFNISLAIAVLAVSILPNLSETTLAAIASLITNEPPNCTKIEPGTGVVLAVFGSGVFFKNEYKTPDHAGTMSLDAAAEYYRQNKERVEKIVVLEGQLYPKDEEISKKYLLKIEPSIPPQIIMSEPNSLDTPTNADELTKLTTATDQIVGITNDSHLARAIKYVCAKDRKAIGLSAEKILKIPAIKDVNTTIREKLALLFSIFFDKQGWISTLLKKSL